MRPSQFLLCHAATNVCLLASDAPSFSPSRHTSDSVCEAASMIPRPCQFAEVPRRQILGDVFWRPGFEASDLAHFWDQHPGIFFLPCLGSLCDMWRDFLQVLHIVPVETAVFVALTFLCCIVLHSSGLLLPAPVCDCSYKCWAWLDVTQSQKYIALRIGIGLHKNSVRANELHKSQMESKRVCLCRDSRTSQSM